MSAELDGRIALVLGWHSLTRNTFWDSHYDFTGIPPKGLRDYVPRWSSDLNLMYELIKSLETYDQRDAYHWALMDVALDVDIDKYDNGDLGYACDGFMTHDRMQDLLEATAAQKAIAWLAVKEKA